MNQAGDDDAAAAVVTVGDWVVLEAVEAEASLAQPSLLQLVQRGLAPQVEAQHSAPLLLFQSRRRHHHHGVQQPNYYLHLALRLLHTFVTV